ncbi:hypothetical protein EC9_29550 [Rosistilla ulvae]|uniref:Uncharacterized protein n=1 Tax=Rosistilla ulvae TaxID=1930277 RepID=A0A517M1K9_9BACT|nr:hypothetical protein [Rosistilla ulvae]QDS88761.1 hypothetical protein EC9_29550 [Rosistilla ulvae]
MKLSKRGFAKSDSRKCFETVPHGCRSGSTAIVIMFSMLFGVVFMYSVCKYERAKAVARAEEKLSRTAEELFAAPIQLDSTSRERTHIALDVCLGNHLVRAVASGNPAVQKEQNAKLQSFLEKNVIGEVVVWEFEVAELGSKDISTGFLSSKKVDYIRVFVPELYNTYGSEGQVFDFICGDDIPDSVFKQIRMGDKVLVRSEIVEAHYGKSSKSYVAFSAPFGTDKNDLSQNGLAVLSALESEFDVRQERKFDSFRLYSL